MKYNTNLNNVENKIVKSLPFPIKNQLFLFDSIKFLSFLTRKNTEES